MKDKIIKQFNLPPDYFKPTERWKVHGDIFPVLHEAADRIMALDKDSNIFITVDNDLDGVVSFSIWFKYLRDMGFKNVKPLMCKGKKHGIGNYQDEIHSLILKNAIDVLFILDSSSDQESIQTVEKLSKHIDQIYIFDHHEPVVPVDHFKAQKINNVLYTNSMFYPEGEKFCTAMVMLAMCRCLDGRLWVNRSDELQELVMIAIIGDVMSLQNMYNRYVMHQALTNPVKNPLLKELMEKRPQFWNSTFFGFYVNPFLNAPIRLENNDLLSEIMRFLTVEKGKKTVEELVEELESFNESRKVMQKDSLATFEDTHYDINLYLRQDFPEGLRGLICSDLVKKFGKPAIIIDAAGKGSCRSTNQIDIRETIRRAGYQADGHAQACGINLDGEKDLYRVANALEKNIAIVENPLADKFVMDITEHEIINAKKDEIKEISLIDGKDSEFVFRLKTPKIKNYHEMKGGFFKYVTDRGFELLDFGRGNPDKMLKEVFFKFKLDTWNGKENLSGVIEG